MKGCRSSFEREGCPFKDINLLFFLKNDFLVQDCSLLLQDEMCQAEMLDKAILFLLALKGYHVNIESVIWGEKEEWSPGLLTLLLFLLISLHCTEHWKEHKVRKVLSWLHSLSAWCCREGNVGTNTHLPSKLIRNCDWKKNSSAHFQPSNIKYQNSCFSHL